MGFKVEEKFRIILVMKEVNLTNSQIGVRCPFKNVNIKITDI